MKNDIIKKIIIDYLEIFPSENKRLEQLINYINNTEDNLTCDWNNKLGHLTAGSFIYSTSTKRFLMIWHNDLQMYLYPGGHCESKHESTLETAISEVVEETGITDFSIKSLIDFNKSVPIDIDIHSIPYNSRVGMPEHLHFDFRYVFIVDQEYSVKIDKHEIGNFKWVDEQELAQDETYAFILKKIKTYMNLT